MAAAEAAGVEFSFGLEASDIHRRDGRITGVGLADGSEIAAQSVISTLDLKRTFLTFFAWNALPKPLVRGVNAFRMAGSTARVLFALERTFTEDGPIHVAPSLSHMSEAFQAWRSGVHGGHPPVTLNAVSSRDPSLAPPSCSVVTATLGAIPFRLFDGAWTFEKRELLRRRAIGARWTPSGPARARASSPPKSWRRRTSKTRSAPRMAISTAARSRAIRCWA